MGPFYPPARFLRAWLLTPTPYPTHYHSSMTNEEFHLCRNIFLPLSRDCALVFPNLFFLLSVSNLPTVHNLWTKNKYCECRMQHLTRAGLVMHSKDGFTHMCVCVPLHVCNICMFMRIFSHDDIFTHNPLNMRIKTKPRQTDLWLPLVLLQLFPCVSSLCLIHWTGGGVVSCWPLSLNATDILLFMSMQKAWSALSHVLHILVNANVISSIGESPSY